MKPQQSLIALTVLALVLPLAAHAQQRSDPILGTWTLNVAKSTFDPGPAPQSETRTFVQTPDGIHVTDRVVTANGYTHTVDNELDGKPYRLFTVDPNIVMVVQTRVSPLVAKADLMRLIGGKPQLIGHRTRVESRNRKTLTFDATLTTPTGQPVHDVTVWDRQ